ncbi:MAG TPA: hypothetical protein PKE55_01800 [Kiritimatiellia bacterium]|nr:hypothetical protein [Kiritimatiellia bacterium]
MKSHATIQAARLLSIQHRILLAVLSCIPPVILLVLAMAGWGAGMAVPGLYFTLIKTMTFATGIVIAILCFLQLAETGQLLKAVIATPLLVGGILSLVQVLAAEQVLPYTMPSAGIVIATWHVSEILVLTFLSILSAIFLMSDSIKGRTRQQKAFLLVTGLGTALSLLGVMILYFVANHPALIAPFAEEGAWLPPVLGWAALALILALAFVILPTYMLWQPSAFLQLTLLACLPLALAHGIMAITPTLDHGLVFAAVNTAIFTAYLLPAVGLILDYRWTYQATQLANQTLRNECFLANQLQATSNFQEQRLNALVDNILQPVFYFDTSFHLVKVNRLGAKIGLNNPDANPIGRTPRDILKPGLAEVILEGGHELLAGQKGLSLSDDWISNGKDNPRTTYRWHFHAIYSEEQNAVGLMVLGEEIGAPAPVLA